MTTPNPHVDAIRDTLPQAIPRVPPRDWNQLSGKEQRVALKMYHKIAAIRGGKPDRRQVVYFLQRADWDIKIGTTTNLMQRWGHLECEHGELRLLGTELGGYQRENELHHRFARQRMDGEWFYPFGALHDYLMNLHGLEGVVGK